MESTSFHLIFSDKTTPVAKILKKLTLFASFFEKAPAKMR